MGLLIDSTLLIRAERDRLTPAELVAEIVGRWGDVELAISVMTIFSGLKSSRPEHPATVTLHARGTTSG